MPRPYTPLAVANTFIVRYQMGSGIEHMKLQKLVYCANGWWLAFHPGSQLVTEAPQVWKFGPVFPSLYQVLKVFGRTAITTAQSRSPFEKPSMIDDDDSDSLNLVDWTWRRYGHLSGFALSDMTHKPGTAWYRAADENKFLVPEGFNIPSKYISEEFLEIYQSESRRQPA